MCGLQIFHHEPRGIKKAYYSCICRIGWKRHPVSEECGVVMGDDQLHLLTALSPCR